MRDVPDLWRRNELGMNGGETYAALSNTPRKVVEIEASLGIPQRTVRRTLARMTELGLAVSMKDGWILGPADPWDIAKRLRSAGADARQRKKHEFERERFRQRIA